MNYPTNRRDLLKGLSLGASGLVLQPFVHRLAMAAEGPLPPRFLFVVEGNGLPPKQIHPMGIPFVERENREQTSSTSLRDLELPPSLKPIEPFRDRLAI